MSRFLFLISSCCFLLLLASGCRSLERQLADSEELFWSGQYQAAADAIKVPAEPTSEALLPNLYRASNHLMAAQFDQCLNDLVLAEDGFIEQDNSVNWMGHYLGRTYDGLMVQTYRALTYLILGDSEYARVAFNNLELRQGEASRRSRKAIEKAQGEIDAEREKSASQGTLGYLDSTLQNSDNQAKLEQCQRLLDQWGAYADYESPIGRFLSGLFRLFYLTDQSDADKAIFQLKRAYGMTNSEVAKMLWDLAEMRADGKISRTAMQDYVVVVFENGVGPVKEEQRYELFIPYEDPIYVGIALPMLVEQDAAYPFLTLLDGNQTIGQTTTLCSIDRLVATEFRKELPWIITKEVTSAVIKAVLQVVAIEVTRNNYGGLAAIGVGLVGSGLAYVTTSADVRGWNLLPKEYQAAIVHRPASGRLGIATPDSSSSFVEIELPPGPALVYVKIPAAGLPALVNVMGPETR